ncbi:hypothetical protein BAC1_01163 [uncultured bacterium]|nr:hypothetical protein BAC1_01163 [uncultured bacterium]
MAPDNRTAVLKKLLELSTLQRRLADESRVEELLVAQAEREALFATLDLTGKKTPACEAEKELAAELAESDLLLSGRVQSVMDTIGSRLGQVKTGMSALKAYGRY